MNRVLDYSRGSPRTRAYSAFGQVFFFRKDGSKTSSTILQRGNDLFVPYLAVPKAVYFGNVKY